MALRLQSSKTTIEHCSDCIRHNDPLDSLTLSTHALRQNVDFIVARAFLLRPYLLEIEMRGAARIACARQVAMYLVHVCCGLSHSEVGRIFGRDRTTAAHAASLVEERREDATFDHIVETLERALQATLRRLAACLLYTSPSPRD